MNDQTNPKPFCLLAALLCVASLCACANDRTPEPSAPSAYLDGSYTATAAGKNGDFEVTVLIADGSIREITTGENQETPDWGGKAMLKLTEQMLLKQTYNVDAVSGSTITSDAFKDAVRRCLEQAAQ